MVKPKTTTIATTIAVIIAREVALNVNVEALDFGVPTKIGVPAKAEAGIASCALALIAPIMQDTVSGAVNVVATDVHVFPSQYSMTLALLKLGSDMFNVPETSELKAPPFEMTLTA
jgi:hypothetical protein